MKLLFRNTFCWMIKNFDLISVIVATCLTWISRFDFSKSVNVIVRDQVAPEYFFPPTSIVNDFPNGSLISGLNKFRDHNILLIYSYSHWDAESIMHKDDIEKAAKSVQYKIPVISINCWDNNSDCYEILRPTRFPQLFAYISNSYFIEYKRSIEPVEIFNFISSLFYPFYFPKSPGDLEYLSKSHDASFIICLNSDSNSFARKIRIFSRTASTYKGEHSDRPNIAFIFISESDTKFFEFRYSLNLTAGDSILYSPTAGIKKTYAGDFYVKEILEFLRANAFSPVIIRYSPSGIKSLNIQNLLKTGYVIFYVYDESRKYLWDNIKSRFYFENLAFRVSKCSDDSLRVSEYLSFIKERTISNYLNQHKINLTCQLFFKSKIYNDYSFDTFSYLNDLTNSSRFSSYQADPFVLYSLLSELSWSCRKYLLMNHYKIDEISMLSENIQDLLLNSTAESNPLFCSNNFNRTITFAEIDGGKFSFFLEKWGIPSKDLDRPKIIVIDWKNEIIHNMQSEITENSMNNLLKSIFINNLTSHTKSNHYPIQDLVLRPNLYPIDVIQLEQELNDPETDLIVFYYTPWCSYCSSIMHLLIMLARYFRNYSHLHFTSLDSSNNDLPYKYQSERIPALIMFPRGRKSNSFVFQITDKSVTLSSLVRFVLENSGDVNLNLNSPPVNYNNEYNVTCNRLCIESARQSVTNLLNSFKHAYRAARHKYQEINNKISRFCSFDEFHWLYLKVENAKDWLDYRIMRYYMKFQAQLISDLNAVSNQRRVLHNKISKLAHLTKALAHIQKEKSINQSVQSLAKEILNFSI